MNCSFSNSIQLNSTWLSVKGFFKITLKKTSLKLRFFSFREKKNYLYALFILFVKKKKESSFCLQVSCTNRIKYRQSIMTAKSVNIGIKRNHTTGTAMFLHRFHNPPLVFIRLIAFHGVQWGYSIVTPTHIELIIQCCCTYGTEKLTSIKKGIFFKKKNICFIKAKFFSPRRGKLCEVNFFNFYLLLAMHKSLWKLKVRETSY